MQSDAREVAVAAARAGGLIIRRGVGRVGKITKKGVRDLVTEYDGRAEAAIVAVLRQHFPGYRVLAEEGSVGGDDPRHVWIIDPIDGTTNFAHGYPFFSTSIALEVDGTVTFGVVYDPTRDELFVAERGKGATVNGVSIAASKVASLADAMLLAELPHDQTLTAPGLDSIARLTWKTQAIRRGGSAALDLAYVASGRCDGFWEPGLGPWDCAAGALLVAEAGGTVTDLAGGPLDIYRGEVLATNGLIHEETVRALAER